MLPVLAAGCFQSTGGALEATNAALGNPTFTLIPTDTDIPSPTIPIPTNTSDVDATLIAAQPTLDLFATLPGTEVASVNLQSDFDLTSTAIYLTANAPFVVPTLEPITDPVTDPLLLSATAMVAGATQTEAVAQTQTMLALLGVTATSPFVQPTNTLSGGVVPIGADCVHEVRAADRNLFRIGLAYGVPYQQIATYNNLLNPNLIYVGQRIIIPGCGTTGVTPPPTSVASATFTGGTQIPGGTPYVVVQGDTLFALSLRFGVPVATIAARNGIVNINLIYIGQTLYI
jgi:LysM repeat protein